MAGTAILMTSEAFTPAADPAQPASLRETATP